MPQQGENEQGRDEQSPGEKGREEQSPGEQGRDEQSPGEQGRDEQTGGGGAERQRLETDFLLALRRAGSIMQLLGQMSAERIGINVTDLNCLNIVALTGPMTAGGLARETALTAGENDGGP